MFQLHNRLCSRARHLKVGQSINAVATPYFYRHAFSSLLQKGMVSLPKAMARLAVVGQKDKTRPHIG